MNPPPFESRAAATVLRTDAGGVATLTLNRPAQYNAINRAMLGELQAALDAIGQDDSVRVVVLAGAGRAFSPGHDLKEMLANSTEEFIGGLFRSCCDVMLSLRRLPQPVIAKVHGIATAAGCQLVAGADMAVAAADARFATSGIDFGLFCATPGVPVSRNIAAKRAFEMVMTGEFIDAPTALAWGLVNRVAPPGELDAEVASLARVLMGKPRRVLAAGKKFFYEQLEQNLVDAYAHAAEVITQNMLGADAQEGVAAFVAKRKPRWDE
ncbi:MAG TPA: enoyl-CoA hydratase [Casimicrobiaceae bacterium]|jgi:enoyl-CoA hydratase/carnithine racemase|nr:enoyl-CoA hydratase [Casimicrobiaceae bacterium]